LHFDVVCFGSLYPSPLLWWKSQAGGGKECEFSLSACRLRYSDRNAGADSVGDGGATARRFSIKKNKL
jgi:hypothetical protein